jgi:hypothetical protein
MLAAVLALPVTAGEESGKNYIDCQMTFDLAGWSAIYKTAKGTGKVSCSNGQSANVTISAKGGGLTAGKTKIEDGLGKFSNLQEIGEVYGSYAAAEAHAGATGAATAQAMTKGEVSLALSGTGRGWSLGIAFGSFTIKPAGDKAGKKAADGDKE